MASTTNPSRPGDLLGYATVYGYDSLGRLVQTTTPDGAVLATAYSGNTTTVVDAAGKQRKFVKNALGALTDVYEGPGASNLHTQYIVDIAGNVRQVLQGSQTRTFVYDSLNRLTSATNPESGTASYSYDAVGNLQSRTDARGIVTSYAYDALDRPLSRTYSNDPNGTPTVTYTYDPAVANGKGQLGSVSNGSSTTSFTSFDVMGNVLASSQVTAGQTYNFGYAYNLAGSLISETYPSGRVIATAYDGANRLQSVTGNPAGLPIFYLSNVAYAPQGAPAFAQYGNTVQRQNSYNSRLQVSGYTDVLNTNTSSPLLSASFNWGTGNNNGNLQGITYNHGGASLPQALTFTQSFGYDNLNRLTSAIDSGGWSRSFGYDLYGNMWVTGNSGVALAGNTPTSNVFTGSNQISGSSYDGSGNRTVVNGDAIAYDAENRQISATEPPSLGGGTESYVYDGGGQRIEKAGPSGTVVFVYDAFGQLAAEYSTVQNTSPCATCYLSLDPLGTPRLITDENGNVVARHDYLPFGEEIPAGTAGRNSQWGTGNDNLSQKFTGQIRDSETGVDYFNARYFTAPLGRFNSPDPGNAGADITDPQSWNGYAYVRNGPLALTDPSGMESIPTFSTTGICGLGCFDEGLSGGGGSPLRFRLQGLDPLTGYPSTPATFSTTKTGVGDTPTVSTPPSQSLQPPTNGTPIAIVPLPTQRSCSDIANDIADVRNDLARRFQQYGENAQPLPLFGPFSRGGHVQQITNKQTNLRNLLNEFNTNGCGGTNTIPGDAWQFATRQAPGIAPSRPWVKYTAIGAGVVIVGGTAIFAPELLPLEFAFVP